MSESYYVYVYIDPRNFQEFYYGKGCGGRMNAHLGDVSDSSKAKRIREIQKAGLQPIVRVVARDLSESQALLVEKTLIWKLGATLANVATGHYASHFRPHNTMYRKLPGFDYSNGVYFFNVGESKNWIRDWNRCRQHGFVCAGHGQRYVDAIRGLNEGDIIAAYLKGRGYVGIGRVLTIARPIREVQLDSGPLLAVCPEEGLDCDKPELTEWACRVQWLKSTTKAGAKWKPRSGLYSSQLVRASLDKQSTTVKYLENEFGIPDLFHLAGARL